MQQTKAGATLTIRLCLMITGLLAIVTVAGGAYVIQRARDDTRDETASTLNLTRHFLDAQVRSMEAGWSEHGYAPPRFQLSDLSDIRHLTLRYYDTAGKLLESNQDLRSRTMAPRWFDSLVRAYGRPVQTVVVPLLVAGVEMGRIVVAPDPSYETDEMWDTCQGLLRLLLSFFILVNALVWWSASRALRPVERILQGLAELRSGNLAARLPPFDLPELSRIGVGFNHMAETLEFSVMENQRLTRHLIETQESERTSIARELHDEIGQCVSAIHADATAIRDRGDERMREGAEAIAAATTHLKNIVRSMLQRLRPPLIAGVGLTAALRDLVASFRYRNPQMECTLTLDEAPDELADNISVAVYRIAQECLTNIAVHADAGHASIDISRRGEAAEQLHIKISDDGVGFLMPMNKGLGLIGIKERVNALHGSCVIETQPGRGTTITLSIPLGPAASNAQVTQQHAS